MPERPLRTRERFTSSKSGVIIALIRLALFCCAEVLLANMTIFRAAVILFTLR
jgi:hypothetical protein